MVEQSDEREGWVHPSQFTERQISLGQMFQSTPTKVTLMIATVPLPKPHESIVLALETVNGIIGTELTSEQAEQLALGLREIAKEKNAREPRRLEIATALPQNDEMARITEQIRRMRNGG